MEEKPCEGLAVMVIDDEPIVGRTLGLALPRIGCSVESFTDPEEALRRFGEEEFPVVLTDVVMGDVDGIQVLEWVREVRPRTKVVIMTAFAMMHLARRAMEKGAFDFIAKPFPPEEIRGVVARACRAWRADGGAPS